MTKKNLEQFYFSNIGFVHSSYLFGLESHIVQTSINANIVPPGALLSLIQKGLYYTEAELSIGDDGQDRTCDSLSLIDAVVPEIVENRRKELQQQSSSSGTSVKNETKLSSRIPTTTTTTTTATTVSNINDKDISPMHQPTNTSPQSTNQNMSDRTMDTPTTSNGGNNY
ncbi:unnamed protein product, partial [Rotaria socialis]